MLPIYFNGKFYAGGMNGVHRVADRLIREVDALLAADGRTATLLLPAKRRLTPELSAIRLVEEPHGATQAWEQAILPRRAKDGVLVNLCNLAPLLHKRKLLLLHDAQFLFPDNGYPARQALGYRYLTPRMAKGSAQVLTVSEYSRSILDLTDVSPRSATEVLHNGADHILETAADASAVGRAGLEPGRYVLLFGSHKGYKNVRVVFDAARDPAWPQGVRIAVVGPDRARLEQAGIMPPDDAVMVGGVDDSALRALYEHALCLAFPSRTEGFGLPPVEGMLCGCPAIVSPAGAIPEVCGDAVLYCPVDRPQAWARAVYQLANDSTLRANKVAAGIERASAFTWAQAGRTLYWHLTNLAFKSETKDISAIPY